MTEPKRLVSRIDPETLPGSLYAVRRNGLLLGEDSPNHMIGAMMVTGVRGNSSGVEYTVKHFTVTSISEKTPLVIIEDFLLAEGEDIEGDMLTSDVEKHLAEFDGQYGAVVRALQEGTLKDRHFVVYSRGELFGKSVVFSRGRLRNL